jgi:hypothetical protein
VIALLDYLFECGGEYEGRLPTELYLPEGLSFHAYACKAAAEALQAIVARSTHAVA